MKKDRTSVSSRCKQDVVIFARGLADGFDDAAPFPFLSDLSVKDLAAKTKRRRAAQTGPVVLEERDDHDFSPPSEADDSRCGSVLSDRKLVERCLAGEVAAWEELYAQCHQPLLSLISAMLRQPDASLVDEIAARVWYALVENDGELLGRFDPARGTRLITFMRALARDLAARHYRSELRRQKREREVLRQKSRYHIPEEDATDASLDEFMATLTPHERGFCSRHHLATPSDEGEQLASPDSVWQLTRRIRRKLLRFLHREP